MSFVLDDDQLLFRRTVREFLQRHSSEEQVRALMASSPGYDAQVWKLMAEQLGLQGLGIPETYGGSGFSLVEVGIVLAEMGSVLLCSPYFATVAMAGQLLQLCDDETVRTDYLPGIAAGQIIGTVAFVEDDGCWDRSGVTLASTRDGDAIWRLNGHKSFVLDGHLADLILVVGRTPEGVGIFAVDAAATGLSRSRLQTFDQTRQLARLEFSDTPARLISGDQDAWPVVERGLQLAASALAMEQAGGARRALDMAVDYIKVREQFGRKIGSFQAIKHRCADLLVQVEAAQATAYHAIAASANLADDLAISASLAKAYCSDTYAAVAAENIQLHGGIGFTWEHPAHLYFRRAKSTQLFFGDSAYHKDRVAQHLGLAGGAGAEG
jgi:alkylation response protein AidB-like acyl-CoA dehydrogenase